MASKSMYGGAPSRPVDIGGASRTQYKGSGAGLDPPARQAEGRGAGEGVGQMSPEAERNKVVQPDTQEGVLVAEGVLRGPPEGPKEPLLYQEDDCDEGPMTKPVVSMSKPMTVRGGTVNGGSEWKEQIVAMEQLPPDPQDQPQLAVDEEYSLIHDGDSLVQQLDHIQKESAVQQKKSKPMTEYGGGGRAPQRPEYTSSATTTYQRGHRPATPPVPTTEKPIDVAKKTGVEEQQSVRQTAQSLPLETNRQIVQQEPMVSAYGKQSMQGEPPHFDAHNGEKSVAANDGQSVRDTSAMGGHSVYPGSVKQPSVMPSPSTHAGAPLGQPQLSQYRQTEQQMQPANAQPNNMAANGLEEMAVNESLNDSNVAQVDDSLDENSPARKRAEQEAAQQEPMETASKMLNNFDRYEKDEAGMSIFAPPDIDYSHRADRAEASLLKYDSDVRSRLEKVAKGLTQVFSNIQKMNISAQESTRRFKAFFEKFIVQAEGLAARYMVSQDWNLMYERKDMAQLRPPGNLKQLQETFDSVKKHRNSYAVGLVEDVKKLQLNYKAKIVDENFYEEGIDQKSTQAMYKGIEQTFEAISRRNKKCVEEFDSITKKLGENKLYFEKNKKFKTDTFEEYVSYLRTCYKLWQFIVECQERLVSYWKRVRRMEEMRIMAISNILEGYFSLESRMTTHSKGIESLQKMHDQLNPAAIAASIYNDQNFMNSPILESLGLKLTSIEVFTQEIVNLKTRVPDIVEFSLWDYMNGQALIKNNTKSIRIFRSNENVLYVYETPDRQTPPMEEPIFKCKVSNLNLQVDPHTNGITLKNSSIFSFSGFTFHLRDHKDHQEVINYVTKFCKNSSDLAKQGIGVTVQR